MSEYAEETYGRRSTGFAIWLIVAGAIGMLAAFQLTIEELHLLKNPNASASCDFSILVQCGKNLESAQGHVFGFPNPVLGLMCWGAPIVVGAAILAGARFAKWFWALLWVGFLGAFTLVSFFFTQSIYVLSTLCPWCMVTWAVVIPTFYALSLHLYRIGVMDVSERGRERADRLMAWVPLATILSYGFIILLAQLRLNAIVNIWRTFFG